MSYHPHEEFLEIIKEKADDMLDDGRDIEEVESFLVDRGLDRCEIDEIMEEPNWYKYLSTLTALLYLTQYCINNIISIGRKLKIER